MIGHRSIGLSVGYQVASNTCVIQLIDSNRRNSAYRLVSKEPFCLLYSKWSPNHQYAAIRDFPSGILSIATGHNSTGWEPVFDIEGVIVSPKSPVWSADSQQLAFLNDNNSITVLGTISMENDVPNKPRLFTMNTTQPIPYSPLAWSPDGKFIAFAAYAVSHTQGSEELYLLNVGNGDVRRLTTNSYSDDSPSWSPNGTELVFTSLEHGYDELYIMQVTTGERRQLTYFIGAYSPIWSPDGKTIMFQSKLDYGYDLYVIGANGFGLRRITFSHSLSALYPVWLVGLG